MKQAIQATLALLLMLQAFPTAAATHLVPEEQHVDVPDVPETEAFRTDVVPIDDLQREAAIAANRSLDPARDAADEAQDLVQRTQDGSPMPGTLTLFRDSLDATGRRGGYGEYAEDGDNAWGVTADADPRLTTATLAGARYPGNVESLLVLPELDLRTGVVDPLQTNGPAGGAVTAAGAVRDDAEAIRSDAGLPLVGPLPEVPMGLSAVHRFLVQTVDLAHSRCFVGPLIQGSPACQPGTTATLPHEDQDSQPREGTHVLEFERRMNLARNGPDAGRDGVRMLVFTQEPTPGLLESCAHVRDIGHGSGSNGGGTIVQYGVKFGVPEDPVCTIVEPLDRAPLLTAGPEAKPTAAFRGEPAYTGSDGWRRMAIDLTPWAERQVWVAFHFASGNTPGDAYFRNPNVFALDSDRRAEFYGVELDDFELTVPALPHSVRVRPIHDPWFVPYQRDRPTVPVGDDLPLAADVANVGTRAADVTLTARVVDRQTDETVWSRLLGDVRLGVGDVHRVQELVPGLTQDEATYTLVVDATQSRGHSGLPEADATDSLATLDVDVASVRHLVVGSVERRSPTYASGDTVAFDLALRNDGNAPLTTVLLADLVNTVSQNVVQGALAPAVARQVVTVAPRGAERTVSWSFPVQDAGQYRLFVRIDDEAGFDAARDLRPVSLQPRSMPFIDGVQVAAPQMDGTIGATEWPTASFEAIQMRDINEAHRFGNNDDGFIHGRLGAATDGERLYLALDIPHRDSYGTDMDEVRFYLDLGGAAPALVPASLVQQQNVGTGVGVRRIAEAVVPFALVPTTPLAVGGTFGILATFDDYGTGDDTPDALQNSARFPLAGLADGEGFQPPDGSRRDEMASWHKLRLSAPGAGEPRRLLSLGVGVDRAPPPVLELDPSHCSDLDGWTQSYVLNPGFSSGPKGYHPDAEKWNCAPYGEDGRTRLYEGRTPFAHCDGKPCGQWARMETDPSPLHEDRRTNFLVSPPLDIPSIPEPYLILRHQYASEAYLADEAAQGFGAEGLRLHDPDYSGQMLQPDTIAVSQQAQVFYEELDPGTGTWTNRTLLRPDGGYSTEESVGLADPARPRTAPTGTGWWWPTGAHPHYKPAGATIAGATFTGSPWTVDRIPLFGGGHGASEPPSSTIVSQGKTIRLLFAIPNAVGTPSLDEAPRRDFGWRIEGIAVAEGPQFARDVAVTEVEPVTALYDPHELGLGPGTPLTVNVTVANRGTDAVDHVRVCVRALDVTLPPPASKDPCVGPHAEREASVRIAPGAQARLGVPMTVPDNQGALLSFQAAAALPTGDDFPADNVLRNATVLPVRRSPDLAIEVGSDQPVAGVGQSRALFVRVVNTGNVPVTGFTVERTVSFEDGTEGGTPILGPDEWTADAAALHGTLAIGASRGLDAIATTPAVVPTTDLRMPGVAKSGAYTFAARVSLPGDIDPQDDTASMVLRTQDVLASQPFSGSTAADLPSGGTPGVWNVVGGTLLAGDPAIGEIPVHADATVELTAQPIDLRSAREATLTLKHRFDLEAVADGGFDAGRVEISTDGGTTWRPLRPEPSPLQGLPDGYPSIPLTGDSALAGLTLGEPAVAFTGRSADLPGADAAGWIRSQFDLAQDPGLARATAFEDFSLGALSPRPAAVPAVGPGGQAEFRGTGWVLKEDNAESRLRYWWIENLTLQPRPRSEPWMWWSGTAGADQAGDPQELVHDRLDHSFTSPQPPAGRSADEVLMTWWQWRAGEADGGTGARFTVQLLDATGTDLAPGRPLVALDEDAATGWRRLGIPLTGLAGQDLTLRFDYDSAARPGFADPRDANNRGWFVDDLQAVAYRWDARLGLRHDPVVLTPIETLDPTDATSAAWSTEVVAGTPGRAPTKWTIVQAGAAARDGGWHVAPVDVPGQGEVPAWRFADGSRQGYPHGTESRLVTPLVDLSQGRADLRLTFDHQYWFESTLKCPLDLDVGSDPEERAAVGCYRSAIDSGAIEYQVFDPATRSFGPWQPLAKGFDDFPDLLMFDGKTDDCGAAGNHQMPGAAGDSDPANGACTNHRRWTDRLTDLPGNRGLASYGGYPAIEERGFSEEALHIGTQGMDGREWGGSRLLPVGHGTSFAGAQPGLAQLQIEMGPHSCTGSCLGREYLRPWREHPVNYVFSGRSAGTEGWSGESWDVSPLAGQQVRFAFHAASNPGLQADSDLPNDPDDRGWSIANLRVQGDTLDGEPVRLRLHLATDGSLGAGEWRIDEATVNGERFRTNAAVLSDGPTVRVADRGDTVTFAGRFATIGAAPLEGVVAVLSAVRESDLDPYGGDVTLDVPGHLVTPVDVGDARPGVVAAYRLKPLDIELQPSIPFTLGVKLPNQDDAVLLRWSLLQDQGGGVFKPFPLDVPGNTEEQWVARALRQDALDFAPPVRGLSGLLVADPAVPVLGREITVSANVTNVGTTDPQVEARWVVERIEHKGDDGLQPRVGDEERDEVEDDEQELGRLAPGGHVGSQVRFTPQQAGLYRVRLTIDPSGAGQPKTTTMEMLIGLPSTYLAVDFADADAAAQGWRDDSPTPGDTGGGTPEQFAWRDVGDRFLWGVTDAQFGADTTYCSEPSTCTFGTAVGEPEPSTPPAPPPVTGLDGRAFGPAVALDRVPAGQAFLTLVHSHNLEEDDGARIEFVPLQHGTDVPAFPASSPWCPGAVSYTLRPEAFLDHRGVLRSLSALPMPGMPAASPNPGVVAETAPERRNPLHPSVGAQMAIGGAPTAEETLRYDLSRPAEAACPTEGGAPSSLALLNYTLVPVLRTGTRPGYDAADPSHRDDVRAGAQGWAIHSLQLSSRSLVVEPASPTFPMQAGASKTFYVAVTNQGQAADRVQFSLDERRSTLPEASWVAFPSETLLQPGETRRVPVHLDIPADESAQPGAYAAAIRVASVSDPLTFAEVLARVQLRRVLLPDLALSLVPDLPEGETFEAGTVVPVHATVFNVGSAASRQTELVLESVDALGATRPIETLPIAPLCPASGSGCAGASKVTRTVEWAVPAEPGAYRLVGRVDPARAMDETNDLNNVVDLDAAVTPLQQPDLAITALEFNGTSGSFAEEGTLVVITARATNAGDEVAENVRLKIRFGSSTIKEARVPSLEPGQDLVVSVAKVVSRGDFVVGASITHDKPDADIDDDDLRRPLRVRGHELSLQAIPGNLTLDPGATVAFSLNVSNHGNNVERMAISLDPEAAGWAMRVLPNPLTLAPGQTGSTSVELVAPEQIDAGPTTVRLRATPSGHAPASVLLDVPVTIRTRAGAPLLSAAGNQTVLPGNATLDVTVTSAANSPQALRIIAQSPGWTGTPVEIRLEPGANRSIALGLAVPAGAPVGEHAVNVTVRDAKGTLLRSATFVVRVLELPALSAGWSGAAQQAGNEFGLRQATFTLRVTNTGNVPVRADVRLLGLGEGVLADPVPAGPLLRPGDEWLAKTTLRLQPDAAEAFGIAELWLDDGNGTRRAAVLPLPALDAAPDLHVTDVQVSPRGALAAGRVARVHATVENVGSVEAPASVVFVAVNGLLVAPVDLPALAAGAKADVAANVTFTKEGSYLLSVIADGNGAIAEAEDADNGRSLPLEVGEPTLPDRLHGVPAPGAPLLLAVLLAALLLARTRRRDP